MLVVLLCGLWDLCLICVDMVCKCGVQLCCYVCSYVQFVGPELMKAVQTKVKKKTLFPTWSPEVRSCTSHVAVHLSSMHRIVCSAM